MRLEELWMKTNLNMFATNVRQQKWRKGSNDEAPLVIARQQPLQWHTA